LRGDKSTSDIDCYISIESGQWKGERVLRWGERRGADCEFSVGIQRHPQVPGLTIINDYTWDTKHTLLTLLNALTTSSELAKSLVMFS
jgi:hypothetical protein